MNKMIKLEWNSEDLNILYYLGTKFILQSYLDFLDERYFVYVNFDVIKNFFLIPLLKIKA